MALVIVPHFQKRIIFADNDIEFFVSNQNALVTICEVIY